MSLPDTCIVWTCPEPRLVPGVFFWCVWHTFINPYPFDGKLVRKLEAL